MKRFSRKTSEKRVCGRRQAALETALLLAGIYGILLIFCALPQVSFSETAVFLGNALICAGLYALFSFRRKWILRGVAVLLLVLAAAAWLRRESAAVQLLALAGSVSGTSAPQGTDVTFTVLSFLLPIAGTALVISLLLIPLFLDYRRLRRRAQAERMNCREVFRRLMDMIHFAGFLSGCSGMEEDFAARFEKEIPCTEPGDAQRLVQIVSRAAYGRGEPSKEEEAFVKRIYFSTGEWLTGELKGFRRFQFRYLKAFF